MFFGYEGGAQEQGCGAVVWMSLAVLRDACKNDCCGFGTERFR